MKVGEPITYVDTVSGGWSGRYPHVHEYRDGLIRTRVGEIHVSGVFFTTRSCSPFLAVRDEHLRWVRGHVAERSEEGRALLASYALSRSLAA